MSYIDETLVPGEEVLHRTRLHWIVVLGPLLIGIVFAAAAIVGTLGWISMRARTDPEAHRTALLVLVGVEVVVAAAAIGAGWTRRAGIEMAVTNRRLIVKSGILRRRTLELMLPKVESVSVDQGVLGRIAGYGTVVVRGTGGTAERFDRVSDPLGFRRIAQEQIDRSQSWGAAAAPAGPSRSDPANYAPPGSDPAQRFCGQCGASLPVEAQFCPRCGARRMR